MSQFITCEEINMHKIHLLFCLVTSLFSLYGDYYIFFPFSRLNMYPHFQCAFQMGDKTYKNINTSF